MTTAARAFSTFGALLSPGTRRQMQYTYESWSAANENWNQSTVYKNITSKTGTVRRGVKKWMSRAEITRLLGAEACEAVIAHKWSVKKLRDTEIRDHPDAPGCEAMFFQLMHACTCTCSTVHAVFIIEYPCRLLDNIGYWITSPRRKLRRIGSPTYSSSPKDPRPQALAVPVEPP